jgi:hypothetical protein
MKLLEKGIHAHFANLIDLGKRCPQRSIIRRRLRNSRDACAIHSRASALNIVRTTRVRIIHLRNDHKEVMKLLEKGIHAHFAILID